MQFDMLSWGIGIPTGVGVNWLSMWLYGVWKRKRTATDYFAVNWSGQVIEFEGRSKDAVSVLEVMKKLSEAGRNPGQTTDKEVTYD